LVTKLSGRYALRGRSEFVSELLTLPTMDVHAYAMAGSTALDIACTLTLFEIARRLEDHTVERGGKRAKCGPLDDSQG
jgi:hypothetical protein